MLSFLQESKDHFKALVELIYPRTCVGCGYHLVKKENCICSICKTGLPFTNQNLIDHPLADRLIAMNGLAGVFTLCYYNKNSSVQEMMHALKYKKRADVGLELGRLIGAGLLRMDFPKVDLVIPLPLHKRRMAERGYNQAEKLAVGLSEIIQSPVCSDVVVRNRHTPSQTNKSRSERMENVQGAFTVRDPKKIEGKRILLVDDVITTGATLLSCSDSIQKVGCNAVYVAALAKADSL